MSDLDVGIANVSCLTPERVRELLGHRRAALRRDIERLQAAKTERAHGAPYFVRALFERPLVQMRAELQWLSDLMGEVKST